MGPQKKEGNVWYFWDFVVKALDAPLCSIPDFQSYVPDRPAFVKFFYIKWRQELRALLDDGQSGKKKECLFFLWVKGNPKMGIEGHGKLCSVSYFWQASWPAKLIRKHSETLFQLNYDCGSNKARMLSPTGVSISNNTPEVLALAQQTHSQVLVGVRCWDY